MYVENITLSRSKDVLKFTYNKGPVNIYWGVGTRAKSDRTHTFFAKIIIKLELSSNLKNDRIYSNFCLFSLKI